jgi:hypothetical protein
MCAPVTIVRCDHEIVPPKPQQDKIGRCHSGRHYDRPCALLQLGDRIGKQIATGIGCPRVLVGSALFKGSESERA